MKSNAWVAPLLLIMGTFRSGDPAVVGAAPRGPSPPRAPQGERLERVGRQRPPPLGVVPDAPDDVVGHEHEARRPAGPGLVRGVALRDAPGRPRRVHERE